MPYAMYLTVHRLTSKPSGAPLLYTQVKGTLSIPFSASITHLLDGGADVYIEELADDPDALDTASPEHIQQWHRQSYARQQRLQQMLLDDPAALKRLLRHLLVQMLDNLEPEPLDEILQEPAMAMGDHGFFCPDLFAMGFETLERAHQVLDQIAIRLGKPSVSLRKIHGPETAPESPPETDLFA